MLYTLDCGRTGAVAQQIRLDAAANNIANINTAGFQRQEVSFADLLYQEMNASGRPAERGQEAGNLLQGAGVRAAALPRVFSPGPFVETGRPLDLAIAGEGFFQVELPDGTYAYTRRGVLEVSPAGELVNESGYRLTPPVTLPDHEQEIAISFDGVISATGENGATTEAGQLSLYSFVNPDGLSVFPGGLYVPTPASGPPREGLPGTEGFGVLRQGCLEGSNVDLTQEMVSLTEAQRAYQISLRVIQNTEEVWNITNNLRK